MPACLAASSSTADLASPSGYLRINFEFKLVAVVCSLSP